MRSDHFIPVTEVANQGTQYCSSNFSLLLTCEGTHTLGFDIFLQKRNAFSFHVAKEKVT